MNVELLLKVKQHILEEPKRLNMHDWISRYPEEEVKAAFSDLPSCGTTGCIAGWSFLLGLNVEVDDISFNFRETLNLLDISDEEADKLFYLEKWPLDFSSRYHEHVGWENRLQHRAQVTAERIQHFIDTRL